MDGEMQDNTTPYDNLKAWILQLPKVSEAPHRFGGTEFQVEGVEFMHSHGHTWLDIRLSKDDQASALKNREALPHRFAPQAGWVSLRIENPPDLANARKIIQLAYENAKKNLEDIKSRRMQSRL
jgi:luciferase-like monooxygenase